MVLSLTDLPAELLRNILQFAANDTKTLLKTELVCLTLRDVVRSDQTWKWIYPWHPGFQGVETHRRKACVLESLLHIRKEQRDSDVNIIIQDLGVEGWRGLVQDSLQALAHVRFEEINLDNHVFVLRNDTCGVLAELVQEAMHHLLDKASILSCTIAQHSGEYPVVTTDIYQHILVGFFDFRALPTRTGRPNEYFVMDSENFLEESLRDAIVRRLSRRASIVKMTNEVYKLAWETFVRTIMLLLLPACRECIEQNERGNGKRMLSATETIAGTPPLSKIPCQGNPTVVHTPVPGQIERAARDAGLDCTKVYGQMWLGGTFDEGKALRDEAMQEYEFESDDGDESFQWVDENDGSSLLIEDVEEGYSTSNYSSSEEDEMEE